MTFEQIKEKAKEKMKQAKEKAVHIKNETVEFFEENPGLFIPMITGVGLLLGAVTGVASNHAEDWIESHQVEDDVTGLNFRTKHPLTNAEILELGNRMNDGQGKGAALEEMGLLKNEKRRK